MKILSCFQFCSLPGVGRRLFPLFALSMICGQVAPQVCADTTKTCEVAVIGGTPAGVAAAVNAAGLGRQTMLFVDDRHIGGLAAGGLSNTDFESFQSLGGTWKDFMERVVAYYTDTYGAGSDQVEACRAGGYYEPGVAKALFLEMLDEAGVEISYEHRLESAVAEVNDAGRRQLRQVMFEDLEHGGTVTVDAGVFIDATYEGDLAALAGAAYEIGNIQTYNFRICMSKDPSNQIAFADVEPALYDSMDFSGFRQFLLDNPNSDLERQVKIRMDLNDKADFNTKAFNADFHFSIDGDGWAEGSPEYRQAMFAMAQSVAQGFFYFLATDPALDGHRIRAEVLEWGYAADEYPETGHWTPALYVREGRKIKGVYEVTGWDAGEEDNSLRARTHADAVAIGDYGSVAHNKYTDYGITPEDFLEPGAPVTRDWPAQESGGSPETRQAVDLSDLPETSLDEDNNVGNRPFEVPYGSIVPVSLDGLLVPVALSADGNRFNAIRMEPTWTALGQAAGVAAARALATERHPRDVDTDWLRRRLHLLGAMTFYTSDVDRESPDFQAIQYFGNYGFFHATELISTNTNYPAPVSLSGTQWSHAARYHDVLPGEILTPEVETFWRSRYLAVFGAGSLEGFSPTANGALTRGEYLRALFDFTIDDTDMDRLSDVWEREHYGDVVTVAAISDFDQDGLNEVMEQGLDTNPRSAGEQFRPTGKVSVRDNTRWLDFLFRKATDPGRNRVVIEAVEDLTEEWNEQIPDGVNVIEDMVDSNPDGDGSVSLQEIRIKLAPDSHSLIVRMRMQEI